MEEVLLLKEDREEKRERVRWGLLIGEEMKRLGYLAGPMVAVTLSQYLLQVISVMMVGHLGELSLSSTSIAISLCGVTGFSFLQMCCLSHCRSLDIEVSSHHRSRDQINHSDLPEASPK
ncbi:protein DETOXIFICATION 14-like [Olea europaea var. sylvestris]|uniref:protein DETOXIFICATION 14-like n=1 Tax=Olea europaea var. sylvestris TaxID=158386 RepID=UPI000C1D314B|nr:protein DETOXIFICATION 14-like [Olea europaea var. sylvestris]